MRLGQFITGNNVLQRHVASERQALLVVSVMARKAIEQEVLPQIEPGLTSIADVEGVLASTKQSLLSSFKMKDQTYTRLTGYKSIDQSDTQFLDDLLHVLDEWATQTKSTLAEGDSSKQDEIKLKIHVDSEVEVKVDTGSMANVEVETQPPPRKGRKNRSAEFQAEEEEDTSLPSENEELDLNEVRL